MLYSEIGFYKTRYHLEFVDVRRALVQLKRNVPSACFDNGNPHDILFRIDIQADQPNATIVGPPRLLVSNGPSLFFAYWSISFVQIWRRFTLQPLSFLHHVLKQRFGKTYYRHDGHKENDAVQRLANVQGA